MRKKRIDKVLSMVMATVMAGGLSACFGGGDEINTDSTVLNVKIRKAGYGTEYIEVVADAFEEAFKDKGYEINVLAPREDLTGTTVLRDIWSNSGIDVYFTSDLEARTGVTGEFGQMISNMTDNIYKKPAIKLDGTEETETIEAKLAGYDFPSTIYNDQYYGMPFALGFGGLAVNKKVLDQFELELPRTTNELWHCAKVIMEQAKAGETKARPFTYALSDNNYAMSLVNPWLGQYEGYDSFNEFWSFQKKVENEDGTVTYTDMTTDAYEVFHKQGVYELYEATYQMYDWQMSAAGSGSHDLSSAQAKIMKGEAVFYSVGDWMFNEEAKKFPKYLNDVTFINIPMLSSVGTLVFGDNGFDAATCEQILTSIIKYADQHMAAETIKSTVESELSVTLDLEDVVSICERRGYVKDSSGAMAIISQKSEKKELAETFLRFCASTEVATLMSKSMQTGSPFAVGVNNDSQYPYLQATSKIAANPYFKQLISVNQGYRARLGPAGMFPSEGDIFVNKIYDAQITTYDASLNRTGSDELYKNAAYKTVERIYNDAKTNIEKGLANNGGWKPTY